ncbi:MAG: hypothetical protein KY476_10505 [Planctomycetes bacterium]|nr:hypothetical protein [Planctomycetota bacterium]
MRLSRRRLTLQLTPLLDLLLIVIFAQYMEMRNTSRAAQAELAESGATAEDLRERDRALAEALGRLAELEGLLDRREQELGEEIRRLIEREQRVGDLVAELFRIPEDALADALRPQPGDTLARSPAEAERLRKLVREMASRRGHEAVKHLLVHDELQKRCDVWDIHLDRMGVVTVVLGDRTHRFRFAAGLEGDDDPAEATRRAAESFSQQLFDLYKSLPQPKSVVIMLFSYGRIAYGIRKPAFDGLRDAADRMRADSGGRTRFEYANLGYMPVAAGVAVEGADLR